MIARALLVSLALSLNLACSLARAAGDSAAGAMIFEEECSECHTFTGKNKKGPTLRGVVGRKAGSAAGYDDYSDAVKKSDLVWSAEAIDRYLTKPAQFSPSIKMKYEGLPSPKDRADLIEFLKTKK